MASDQIPERQGQTARSKSIAILGCGKLGTAMIAGLLRRRKENIAIRPHGELQVVASPSIHSIYATARSDRGVQFVKETIDHLRLSGPTEPQVFVSKHDQNGEYAKTADIVVLGCKPSALEDMIAECDMLKVLSQKEKHTILISIIGGTSIKRITNLLSGLDDTRTHIFRAILNMAAGITNSITVLSSTGPLPQNESREHHGVVTNLFGELGETIWLPERQLNRASALAASSLAFYADMVLAAAEGVQNGGDLEDDPIAPDSAILISARAAYGAAGLVLAGHHPSKIIDQVATKGGSTRAGLDVMEKGGIHGTMTSAVQTCSLVTGKLSRGDYASHDDHSSI